MRERDRYTKRAKQPNEWKWRAPRTHTKGRDDNKSFEQSNETIFAKSFKLLNKSNDTSGFFSPAALLVIYRVYDSRARTHWENLMNNGMVTPCVSQPDLSVCFLRVCTYQKPYSRNFQLMRALRWGTLLWNVQKPPFAVPFFAFLENFELFVVVVVAYSARNWGLFRRFCSSILSTSLPIFQYPFSALVLIATEEKI